MERSGNINPLHDSKHEPNTKTKLSVHILLTRDPFVPRECNIPVKTPTQQ